MKAKHTKGIHNHRLMLVTENACRICSVVLIPIAILTALLQFVFKLNVVASMCGFLLLFLCGLSLVFEIIGVICTIVREENDYGNRIIHLFLTRSMPAAACCVVYIALNVFSF